MEKIIASFLKENNLIIDKPIIVAVSGGADSVSLLYVLYKLGYEVILAHVNHHKRIESEIEETYDDAAEAALEYCDILETLEDFRKRREVVN